jgi:thiol-disulfide isomerase/thioredoxin
MNKRYFILIFLFIFVIFSGCRENKKYKVTLIEIMSSSCEACITTYKPMVEELKKEFSKTKDVQIKIYDTATDEGVKMANLYGITKLPTFIFLDENNVEYFRMKDIIIKEAIVALINTKLNEKRDKK